MRGKRPGEHVMIRNSAILDRAGDHGGARRDLAHARLRPQLEFRRPLGGDVPDRMEPRKVARWPRTGARLKTQSRRSRGTPPSRSMCLPRPAPPRPARADCGGRTRLEPDVRLARRRARHRRRRRHLRARRACRRRAPRWSGDTLDFVVDFATYVFVPAYAIVAGGLLPAPAAIPAGVLIVVTSALYFADRDMKMADNCFRGFPALWNAAAFYLFLVRPDPWISLAAVFGACGSHVRVRCRSCTRCACGGCAP